MWFGKIIAGLIGLAVAGLAGLVIGVIAGHYFDRALLNLLRPAPGHRHRQVEEEFFRTVFLLMGRLAKCDGRISEREVAHTEQLMAHMGLGSDHRRQAIALFKEGAQAEFDVQGQLASFRSICGRYPGLKRQLLNYLLSLALADGAVSAEEESLLRQVASGLGLSPALFEQLMRMIRAQAHFRDYQQRGYQQRGYQQQGYQQQGYQQQGTGAYGRNELATAYEALGVAATASDAEIKRAYRKLMSENHPDKLMGQGVPADMVQLATERSQEIQTAYDLIRRHRE